MRIGVGGIFKSNNPELPLQGVYRILQILPDEIDELVVLIQVPTEARKGEGAKQRNYYVKGFITRRLSELDVWADMNYLGETHLKITGLWNMSDEDIRKKFPPRGDGNESYPILVRNRKWELIKPIIDNNFDRVGVIGLMGVYQKAALRAKELGVSKKQILDAVHRYYAFGCIKNSLLPNTYACGGPKVRRIAKNKVKLGRKNAAAAVGRSELRGKALTEHDLQNIADGWRMFLRPGTNKGEAFLAMSSTFYVSGYSERAGIIVPDLLEAHLRPTIRQFSYHGEKSGGSAMRRLLGEGEWLKNHRELNGSARTGVFNFGQLASVDASPIDVNLVTCFNRLKPIGVGRAVIVTDVKSDLSMGWHVSIGGVTAEDACLAILNAALDKAAMLKRYDLEYLPVEDFPSIFFSKYISDNGELRASKPIDEAVEKLGSRFEFIPSGRADRNSVAEAGHHTRHKGLDHHLTGTNKGRQKKRGEVLAITEAALSHYEYTRLLIQWIHWRNAEQEVPNLLTVEMRRDNVQPTRIAIYRWLVEKGYKAGIPSDPTCLKAQLLPTFKASVQRNGIILHRPNKDKRVELIRNALFNDIYLASSGLIRKALNGGSKYIEVKADPDDLSQVYYLDMEGQHIFKNISGDHTLIVEGCMDDLEHMIDQDKVKKIESQSTQDQNKVNMRANRKEAEGKAIREKNEAIAKDVPKKKASYDKTSVRTNQAEEKKARLDEAARRASGQQIPMDTHSSDAGMAARENTARPNPTEQHRTNNNSVVLQNQLKKYQQSKMENLS